MALTIELSPRIEAQIREIAESKGLDPNETAKRIFEHLLEILAEGLEQRLHVARAMAAYSTNEQPSEEVKAALLALLESSLVAAETHSAELQRLKQIDSLNGRFADMPTTVDDFLREKPQEPSDRRARIQAIQGKYADVAFSSEDLHRERAADKQRELPEGERRP